MEKKRYDSSESQSAEMPRHVSNINVFSNTPGSRGIWLRSNLVKILLVLLVLLFIAFVVVLALYIQEKNADDDGGSGSVARPSDSGKYKYSAEATRVGLVDFLNRVQKTYYEYNRHELPWEPRNTDQPLVDDIRERHLPYNVTPAHLKAKTDAALALLHEIKGIKMDENKMKPRELKVLEQVKHFLQTTFGHPFDENFYNGDWMLGPNHFCLQPICSIAYNINAYAHYVKPQNLAHIDDVLKSILLNRESLMQYKSNLQLGIRAGMVRSIFPCKSGLDAFKQKFKQVSRENKPEDVLKEWFVENYINEAFIKNISKADRETWRKKHVKDITTSINETLVKGIGEPLVELIRYLTEDHMPHCLPQDLSSGLGNLPVDYIYLNGNKTENRTTKTLPGTNTALNGKEIYKNILPYFTTSDITPERINEIGKEKLKALYPQVLAIAKNITGESNETAAVIEFRKLLKEQKQFYNKSPFPPIESNATAYKMCSNAENAKRNCPKRWEALLEWIKTCRQTIAMLAPKLIPLFYHTGKKITVPNCPLDVLPNFNPSSGVQFFMASGENCKKPAYFTVPFFLENFGPRFSEWSITAHEGWPGHHTQIEGQQQYFQDKYGGVPKWIDEQTSYTFFTEGWALYSENPVIAKDTDTYEDNLFQKFGMLKWQVLRALRLIVDTGLHYRGMNRTEALWYFSTYAWDDTDFAQREITRYQGVPGQATAYMLGQQKLVQLREDAKSKLAGNFSIQDFHYQVLSQGSAPEAYLVKHVEKYVKCTLGELKGEQCDVILKKSKSPQTSSAEVDRDVPPKPQRRHYY